VCSLGVSPGSSIRANRAHSRDQDAGAFLSKKLSGRTHLCDALGHNLREFAAERGAYGSIDVTKMHENYVLHGSTSSAAAMEVADGIVSSADTRGKKLRRDAVWAIELVFTALPKTNGDLRKYFADCTRWAEEEFKAPLLSSVVHLDQGAPHCHVLLVPLVDGKMNGGKLYGNKFQMMARLTSFYEAVGKRYGLNRPQPRIKQPLAIRADLLQRCRDFLSEGRRLSSKQIDTILNRFQADPLPLAESFGVVFSGVRVKPGSFVDRMTSPVGT
jgi:hypothetical protein